MTLNIIPKKIMADMETAWCSPILLLTFNKKVMAKVSPFHSVKETTDRKVYHDNSSCTEGNNIEPENKRSGTDGRPKCSRCLSLS